MPSAPLIFRATCGSFLPVYVGFMLKRARLKAAMKLAMLTPRTRVDGVALGLLLTLMFWGGLLLRCGDVEQNPGPKTDKTVDGSGYKQTRLGTAGRRGSVDKSGGTVDSGQTASSPLQQPSNADIMVVFGKSSSNKSRTRRTALTPGNTACLAPSALSPAPVVRSHDTPAKRARNCTRAAPSRCCWCSLHCARQCWSREPSSTLSWRNLDPKSPPTQITHQAVLLQVRDNHRVTTRKTATIQCHQYLRDTTRRIKPCLLECRN